MNIIKSIFIGLSSLFLASCNGQDAKLKAFKRQKHRFELRECEFYYNEQRIELFKSKNYIEKIFGTNYVDEGTVNFYKDKPFVFTDQIRSMQEKEIRDVSSLSIKFWKADPEGKFYEDYKDIPYMAEDEYILIDGIPFGKNISIEFLNKKLREKGSLEFSGKFAGSSGIKARGYTSCDNFPQFFISYNELGELRSVSYEIRKPKNLD